MECLEHRVCPALFAGTGLLPDLVLTDVSVVTAPPGTRTLQAVGSNASGPVVANMALTPTGPVLPGSVRSYKLPAGATGGALVAASPNGSAAGNGSGNGQPPIGLYWNDANTVQAVKVNSQNALVVAADFQAGVLLVEHAGSFHMWSASGSSSSLASDLSFAHGLFRDTDLLAFGAGPTGMPAYVRLASNGMTVTGKVTLQRPSLPDGFPFVGEIVAVSWSPQRQSVPLAMVEFAGEQQVRSGVWDLRSGVFLRELPAGTSIVDATQGVTAIRDTDADLVDLSAPHLTRVLQRPGNQLAIDALAGHLGIDRNQHGIVEYLAIDAIMSNGLNELFVVAETKQQGGGFSTALLWAVDPTPFRNPVDPLDVDANGLVIPRDVLAVINQLNSVGSHRLDWDDPVPAPFLDVNGDGFVTPIDALLVINKLNGNRGAAGEAVIEPTAKTSRQSNSTNNVVAAGPAGSGEPPYPIGWQTTDWDRDWFGRPRSTLWRLRQKARFVAVDVQPQQRETGLIIREGQPSQVGT